MVKLVTFGELMLKLSPPAYSRLIQAHQMNIEYSGAEANVAVSLSNYGLPVAYITKLPDIELGDAAIDALRRYGIDTRHVVRGGERIGIYFVEKGASQRPSKVIYDRKGSSIACSKLSDFEWDSIFDGVNWFHFTGITPALSDSLADSCLKACRIAKNKGITVSCDLNYRKKLWGSKKAQEVMTQLCQYVDVCIANEEDAGAVFGVHAENSDANNGKVDVQSYISVAQQLHQHFGFKYVAITLRESVTASDNNWSAILYDGRQIYSSRKYAIHLVDRIGGGDAFSAGLIYGLLEYKDSQKALDFATAASCLKQTIEGDFNLVSVAEVENLVTSAGTGRIVR